MTKSVAKAFLESVNGERFEYIEDLEETNFTLTSTVDGDLTTKALLKLFGKGTVLVRTDGENLLERAIYVKPSYDNDFFARALQMVCKYKNITRVTFENVKGVNEEVIKFAIKAG